MPERETAAGGDAKALLRQTGLWRRVEQSGADGVAEELRAARESVAADMGTQALVLHALIEILLEKKIMTEDEFADKLDEIDMRDGIRDGMMRARVLPGGKGESHT